MIIKSQIYNLRLVIVALSTLMCALGYYAYNNYSSLNEYHEFLIDENAMVESELSQMVASYDSLRFDNRDLQTKLDNSRIRIARILDSVKYLQPDVYLVSHYKKQLQVLKNENNSILALVEKLNAENEFLKQEAIRVGAELDQTISFSEHLESKNSTLSIINSKYQEKINKAKVLSVSSISVQGVRRVTNNGDIKSTTTARRAKQINVCFTIPENKFTVKGEKELYVQIVDPLNNVVGDQGVFNTEASSLIYSKKIRVDYKNKNLEQCLFVKPSEDQSLQKGDYYVAVYHKSRLIGKTIMTLK